MFTNKVMFHIIFAAGLAPQNAVGTSFAVGDLSTSAAAQSFMQVDSPNPIVLFFTSLFIFFVNVLCIFCDFIVFFIVIFMNFLFEFFYIYFYIV